MSEPKLTQISGIGPATAGVLESNGFVSVQAIAQAAEAELATVPGFGSARAATIIAAARAVLSPATSSESAPSAPKVDKKKKKKKRKKGKGKSKGKGRDKKKKKKGKKKDGKGKKKK